MAAIETSLFTWRDVEARSDLEPGRSGTVFVPDISKTSGIHIMPDLRFPTTFIDASFGSTTDQNLEQPSMLFYRCDRLVATHTDWGLDYEGVRVSAENRSSGGALSGHPVSHALIAGRGEERTAST